jgi:hypothetical protein
VSSVNVKLFPVSFVLEDGPSRLVALEDRKHGALTVAADGDPESAARHLLRDAFTEMAAAFPGASARTRRALRGLARDAVPVAGVLPGRTAVDLVYTAVIPVPLAEGPLDVASGTRFGWRTLHRSAGKRRRAAPPDRMSGADAVVLDHWRQAFEETDAALDFLPANLTLLQLRGLYDAVWGYDQDASGFKRWAVDRSGALRHLLDVVSDQDDLDAIFYSALGDQLSPDQAARAGAVSRGSLAQVPADGTALAIAVAAATTANRLWSRPGPEPMWYRKSKQWQAGPTWIPNVYPPRPAWTRWDTA